MKSKFKKYFFLILSIAVLISAAGFFFVQQNTKEKVIPFSSVSELLAERTGSIVDIKEYKNGKLVIEINENEYISHIPPNGQLLDDIVQMNNVQYTYVSTNPATIWLLAAIVISMAGFGFYLYKSGKGGIGAANTMKQSVSKPRALPGVSMEDIGGIPAEMKEEILQTLAIIKEPELAQKLGIKPPKGILLYGPPGTGKTLLAQAIAKEIGAAFFSASGSAFNEMFVGVGASRVRSLFQNARKQTPAVVFIDEVDSLAGRRKQHGGEESEKTLTELLVQLDGGHSNDGILFIAATNRRDMLDDAFLRPGRIDFSFHVPLPDANGRKEIIDIHSKKRVLAPEVSAFLGELAESTSGFSGAELNSLFETASRRAARNGQAVISKEDLDFALDRTVLGSSSRALQDEETKRRVAIHEAGHALVAVLTKPGSVRKATIIPRGQALGYVAPIQKELQLSTASELIDQIAMILAGGVAERMFLGEHSIGVGGDVKQAKNIIEQMVDTGMLEDGFKLTFNNEQKEQKMQELFDTALNRAEQLIVCNEFQFKQLCKALLQKETLEGSEVQTIADMKDISSDAENLVML